MINHHPSESTLLAYASGSLPEALAIVVATHLLNCPECRLAQAALEATGGALLEDMVPEPLSAGAADAVFGRFDDPVPPKPVVLNPDLPPPLDRATFGRWWPVAPGVRFRPLRAAGNAWGGLLRAEAGRSVPKHGHSGLELTCVLSGSFSDAFGIYRPGDLSEPETDHDQPPTVTMEGPCVCVIASQGMKLRGLLGAAQRLLER